METADLEGWCISGAASESSRFSDMFNGCASLTSLDLHTWTTAGIKNTYRMFVGCSGVTSLNLNGWDVSSVTDMSNMFASCSALTTLQIDDWNTGLVRDMSYMFQNCERLQRLDLRNFNFNNVTNYSNMLIGIPNSCLVIVKDNTAKNWVLSKFPQLTNVKTIGEI